MSAIFNYTIPDTSNNEITNDTLVNNLLNDIKTTDISNMTYATLEKSIKLKNSKTIDNLDELADFLQELESFNKSLD